MSTAPRSSETGPALTQLGGGVVAQFGAAVGDLGFQVAGPGPIVAVRQCISAIAFLAIARPPIHRMRWSQLWPALALGGSTVVMNLAFYFAIDRLPLGLAVTLEILGPLAVVLISTRRLVDIVVALVAFGGVVLLTGTVPHLDWLGVAFVLMAAAGWAGYIVLSKAVGARLPGLQGSAIAMSTAAICSMPFGIVALIHLAPGGRWQLLGWGALCALLSTIIPQAIDMTVLRRMSQALFGVLQSASPAFAAVAGLLLLHQTLAPLQIAGLVVVSAANALAVVLARRRSVRAGDVDVVPTATGAITVVQGLPEGVDLPERLGDLAVVPDDIGGDTEPIPL